MVEFQLIDDEAAEKGLANSAPKAPLSTSLPLSMIERLDRAAGRLKRGKAVIIRTALTRFFSLEPDLLAQALMDYYRLADPGQPKALTTTLAIGQKELLGRLATDLHRPKADLLRAAILRWLELSDDRREAAVMEYLST